MAHIMPVLNCVPADGESSIEAPPDASLANFFARPHAECGVRSSSKFTVWLDHTDRIISLPPAWDSFAAMAGSPGLEPDHVLGRPVGWFIADATVRECFRAMWERARRDGRVARILSRCDEQGEPRAMQLKFAPMPAGALECSWNFFHGSIAEQVVLVRPRRFCDGEHLRMCSWCRQVHGHRGWQRLEAAAPALGLLDHGSLPAVTHGICPACSASLLAENTPAFQACVAV